MTKFKVGFKYTHDGKYYFTVLKDRKCGCFDIQWSNGAIRTVTLAGFEHHWRPMLRLVSDIPLSKQVTVQEFAELYSICKGSVYGLIKANPTFPAKKVGKAYQIDLPQAEAWLQERTYRWKQERFGDFVLR